MFFTKAGIANSQTLGMHVYTLETGYGLEQSITTLSVPVGDFPPHVEPMLTLGTCFTALICCEMMTMRRMNEGLQIAHNQNSCQRHHNQK
jgi:hypothetical protein